MKLNVCKEITSMDLNDKTIASLQPNFSPRRYNLKLQANEINFENCSTHIAIRFSLLQFCPSVPFVFVVIEMFLDWFTEFYGHLPCLNLAKNRDTAPKTQLTPKSPTSANQSNQRT